MTFQSFAVRYSLLLFLFLAQQTVQAQCSDDTHSSNANDAWLSCTTSASPNVVRGNSHWMLYDLGFEYIFTDTKIWNYNINGETGKGFRNLAIDYSLDGTNWIQAATFELPQASGNSTYSGYMTAALTGIRARYVLVTAISTWNGGSCAGISELRLNVEAGVSVATRVLLQGPYDASTALMKDDLRIKKLLPLDDPYTTNGYVHEGNSGNQSTTDVVFDINGIGAIVDWVVLELRSAADNSEILASRSCLLRRDGKIVDIDGESPVRFIDQSPGNYYVAVRHRNHLAVMTNGFVNLQ